MNKSNPAVDIGGTTSALDRLYPILRAAGGWRQLKWRVAGHYDHIHAAAEGGQVPSDAPRASGVTPFVADAGARLAPGLNILNNKLGKPEPLVRADLLDARLAALQAAVDRNTAALVAKYNSASTIAVGTANGPFTGQRGADSASATGLANRAAGNSGVLRIEGRLLIDENGNAYIRGIAQEVVDGNSAYAAQRNRMGANR
jgi:uncharacterized small protein (DUF1192 family)